MNLELENTLVSKFPRLYKLARPAGAVEPFIFGMECGDGWYQLIYDLSEKLENLIERLPKEEANQAYVINIKEKHAVLHFDMMYATVEMYSLIRQTEAMSWKVCESCGQPGSVRSDLNWSQALCDSHYERAKRKRG